MATKIFGLVGYPLGHSFSKKYFNEKFADENIDAEYKNFEIEDINEVTKYISCKGKKKRRGGLIKCRKTG